MITISMLSIGMLSPDTGIVRHTNDGLLNEWPNARFTDDKGTGIQYALDNDKENLYVALKIADPWIQTQMMRVGMNTYFDMKGKRKENKGVEFPVKKQFGGIPIKQPLDVKEERMVNALNFLSLKLFGFADDDEEPKEQSLEMKGSLQMVFTWDAADILQLEYMVPLNILEKELTGFDQKQISVGWKIKAMDQQDLAGNITGTTTTRVVPGRTGQRPGATTGGFGQSGATSSSSGSGISKMLKDQQVWAKYMFSL